MTKARPAKGRGSKAYSATAIRALMSCAAWSALWGSTFGQEPERREQKPFALVYAKAEDVAPELREALGRLPGRAEVVADVNRNRVVVKGNREVITAAAEMIEELDIDQETEQEPAQEVKPFARGYTIDSEALDATLRSLRELYREQPGVSINADKRTSKIVVYGPATVHEEVSEAIRAAIPKPAVVRGGGARAATPRGNGIAIAATPKKLQASERLEPVHRFRNLSWQDFEDALEQIWGEHVEVIPDEDGESAEIRLQTRDGEIHVLQYDRKRNQVEAAQPEPVAKWKQIARVLDGLETKAGQEAQVMTVAHTKPAQLKEVIYALKQSGAGGDKKLLSAQALRRDPQNARWGGDLVSRVFQQDPAKPAGAQDPARQDPADVPAEQDPAAQLTEDDFRLDGEVQIEYIEGLDLLIIKGNPKDVEKVKKLISLLDAESVKEPELRIVSLKHTNNEVLAPLLTQINDQVLAARQGRVTIIPLVKPNAILLLGNIASVDVMEKYINKLDFETEPSAMYRVFRLKYMSASDAETAIRNFFSNRPGQQAQGGGGGAGAAAQDLQGLGTRVRVIAESRSNSLIVQGGEGDLKDVEALLKDLDVEESPSQAQIRVFPLKKALAVDLAPVLQAAISGQASQGTAAQGQGNQGGQGQNQNQAGGAQRQVSLQFLQIRQDGVSVVDSGIPSNVVVEADGSSNRLIVRGPARTMELVEHLIKELDQSASGGASVRVFRVIHGDAQQIYTNLQTLFGTTTQAGGGQAQGALGPATSEGETPLVGLRFTFDRASNTIIATGNPGDLDMVQAILDNIDQDDMQKRSLAVYRLVNNDAQFVATAVQTIITNQQNQIRTQAQTNFLIPPRTLLENDVFITPEVVTNSVIISATPRKLEEVLRVVQQLDLRQPMVLVQMLIAEVTLENINEVGAEFGLQDSVLFNRGLTAAGLSPGASAGNPGFLFNNATPGNNVGPFPDQANNVAGQGLTSFNVGRTSGSRGYGGLVLSASSESVSVLLRALHERNRLQILSRPEVMTVDRIPANVLVGESVPLVGSVTSTINGNVGSVTRENVGLSLLVIPQVNADGQIVIDVNASRSSLGNLADGIPIPAGNTTVLQPRINITQAVSTVSCRSGQTVIMSGLITKTRQLQERGIPGLMDIPYLGRLFQFRSESDRRTELLMVLTPHIIWDGEDLDWIKQTETERMSWCMADVADLDGDRGYHQGKGLWGSLRHRTIFPHIQPRGVAECTPPPGPLDPLQKVQAHFNPDCPPDPMWQAPPGSGQPPGPPSEMENRSNWGPPSSPHQMLPLTTPAPNTRVEEVPPPSIPEPEEPMQDGEKAPNTPTPPTGEGAMLEGPVNRQASSMRSALNARRGTTRRAEYQSSSDETEIANEKTSYQSPPRAAANSSRKPSGSPPRSSTSSRPGASSGGNPRGAAAPSNRFSRAIEPSGYESLEGETGGYSAEEARPKPRNRD